MSRRHYRFRSRDEADEFLEVLEVLDGDRVPRCDNMEKWRWAHRGKAYRTVMAKRGAVRSCPCKHRFRPHRDCHAATWKLADTYEDDSGNVIVIARPGVTPPGAVDVTPRREPPAGRGGRGNARD